MDAEVVTEYVEVDTIYAELATQYAEVVTEYAEVHNSDSRTSKKSFILVFSSPI
ncbi:hypothetical protein [Oceanobacillus sp. CAU 1775]